MTSPPGAGSGDLRGVAPFRENGRRAISVWPQSPSDPLRSQIKTNVPRMPARPDPNARYHRVPGPQD